MVYAGNMSGVTRTLCCRQRSKLMVCAHLRIERSNGWHDSMNTLIIPHALSRLYQDKPRVSCTDVVFFQQGIDRRRGFHCQIRQCSIEFAKRLRVRALWMHHHFVDVVCITIRTTLSFTEEKIPTVQWRRRQIAVFVYYRIPVTNRGSDWVQVALFSSTQHFIPQISKSNLYVE